MSNWERMFVAFYTMYLSALTFTTMQIRSTVVEVSNGEKAMLRELCREAVPVAIAVAMGNGFWWLTGFSYEGLIVVIPLSVVAIQLLSGALEEST